MPRADAEQDRERTRAKLLNGVQALERQLADLQARWPAHSVPPAMMAELDELETELALARRQLAQMETGSEGTAGR